MPNEENTAGSGDAAATDAGAPSAPIGFVGRERLARIHEELERYTGAGGQATMDGVADYRSAIVSEYLHERPVFTLAWPESLFIPSAADSLQYWLTPAPDDHRYRYAWTDTLNGQPSGSSASAATGDLFAWNNVSGLAPGYIGYAGTGVRFTPKAQLSQVTVGADISLVAETRWWFLPGPSAGYSHISYRGTAFLSCWQIDPVTGAWDLVRPFGARTLFQFAENGQGGSAVSHHAAVFDDLSASVQMQGGRSYAVGVSFEAEILADCRDRSNKPYRAQPGDDIRLWASIAGRVASISVATSTVLIP